MLRPLSKIKGFELLARDGEVGEVSDFLLDDRTQAVRYAIVRSGGWLTGQKVIISPISITRTDWLQEKLQISLTKQQVQNSPAFTNGAISREAELDFISHYKYVPYWEGPFLWGTAALPLQLTEPLIRTVTKAGNLNIEKVYLHSSNAVTGYYLAARDGDIGHLEDLLVEDESWAIRYLVIDTRNWLPGKKVLVAPHWVEQFERAEEKVYLNLTKELIQDSPEYNESALITREYENELYRHYGQPGYWEL